MIPFWFVGYVMPIAPMGSTRLRQGKTFLNESARAKPLFIA